MSRSNRGLFTGIIAALLMFGATSAATLPTPFIPDVNTIALWHFDENSGDTAYDASGNGNHGKIYGAQWTTGRFGSALLFDGTDSVKVLDAPSLRLQTVTIEAWAYSDSFQAGYAGVIVTKEYSNMASYRLQNYLSTGGVSFVTNQNWNQDVIYNQPIANHAWHHIAGVWANDSLELFIDGQSMGRGARSGLISYDNSPLLIGAVRLVAAACFKGILDEVRISNVKRYFRAAAPAIDTVPPPTPSINQLIAHWSFDSTSANRFYDVSGNLHHANVITNNLIQQSAGINSKALECNGNGFKISVENSQPAFSNRRFTIEGWFNSAIDLINPGSFYNYKTLFNYVSAASGIAGGYGLQITDVGQMEFTMANAAGNNWTVIRSDSIIKPRIWYHVAATYDSLSMKLYLNGRLVKKGVNTAGYALPTDNAVIGCQMLKDSTYRNWFNGKIDELKLYNYALDSATIARTYNTNVPQAEAPFEINLGMKQAFAKVGDTVTVPIYLTNYEDFAISSCQFTMHIDPAIITLLDVAKDSGLAKNWTLMSNPARPDSIIIGMAGVSQTLAYGEGELIRCRFIVSGSAAANSFSTIDLRHINVDEANKLVIAATTSGKISIKQPTFMYGDVTGNKVVTIGDAQKVLEYVVGSLTLPDASCPNFTTAVADVSGNGIITSYDAALIFQYSVGLISKFPVESTGIGKRLAKSTAIGAPAAIVSIALPHLISTNIYQYTVHAENIYGLRAGEFAFACDPAIVKSIKDVSTRVRSANIQAQFDAATNRYKVGLTTNDRVTDLASDLLTITVEHKAGVAGTGLGISTALLNEGTIETNFLNQGLQTGIMDNKFSGILSLNIPFELTITNHDIQIGNPNGNAVSVQLFNLQGRRMFSKSFSTGTIKVSVGLTGRSAGLYICRIATGGKAYDRAIMIAQ